MTATGHPQFEFWAVLHDGFESLLHNSPGLELSTSDLVALAFERGRVLLQAPAGAGKSTYLRHLAEELNGSAINATIVRASDLSPQDIQATGWRTSGATYSEGRQLIIVDGLDEVTPVDAWRVLETLEDLTQSEANFAVIVSDRPGRRPLNERRWALTSLSYARRSGNDRPTSDPYGESSNRWADLPLYLDLASKSGDVHSKVAVFARFVAIALSPNREAIDALSSVAFEWWREHFSSVIDRSWLEAHLAPNVLAAVTKADPPILVQVDQHRVRFFHLLLHGYLASRELRSRPELWTREGFEVLTLRGATFDALGMLVAQVKDSDVDPLVRSVDDWNFYAASYLVSPDQAGNRVGADLRAALLVMLAIRRFGLIPNTVVQVEDALRLQLDELADRLLEPVDMEGVLEVAKTIDVHTSWWTDWLQTFERLVTGTVDRHDLALVGSEDALMGWMCANVLALRGLSPAEWQAVRGLTVKAVGESVRWRYVHMLGGAGDVESFGLCLRAFREDNSRWVRYGALRSCISIAANLNELSDRRNAFVELAELADAIAANPKWCREVERASSRSNPPLGWSSCVGLLVEQLWARSKSIDDQDRWRRLSANLRANDRSNTVLEL